MKHRPVTLNYRSALVTTIKKKYYYLFLGLLVVFSISYALAVYTSSRFIFVSKETVKKNVRKSQSAKIELKKYTVRQGDQLFSIAEKFYGSGYNFVDIMKANNLANSDLIEIGQILIIPSVKPKLPTTGEINGSAMSGKVSISESSYTVKAGDDLSKIALFAYGDSYAWTKIAKANGITNPNQLEVGKILIIPR